MAFAYQPKSSVEIPLKDSTENDLQRRAKELCVEVWNLTQHWEELNESTYDLLEGIINNHLHFVYSVSDISVMNDDGKIIAGSSLNTELQGTRRDYLTEVEISGTQQVGSDGLSRIMEKIVGDAQKLAEVVSEEMTGIVGKLRSARKRLAGLKKLEKLQQEETSCNGSSDLKMKELVEILPHIVKMYEEELRSKNAALDDLANSPSRVVLFVILASWTHQAFIDRSLLSRLYSLVV